jgi:hypothetical protein
MVGLESCTSVDVKSALHAKHTQAEQAGLTHVADPKRASQFSLKLTKDENS